MVMRTQVSTLLAFLGLGLSSCAQSAIDDEPASDAALPVDGGDVDDAGDGSDPTMLPMRDGGLDGATPSGRDGGADGAADATSDSSSPTDADAGPSVACSGEGIMACGTQCIDTRSSNRHCSTCNKACLGDETCKNSLCQKSISSGCSTFRAPDGRSYMSCTEPRTWTEARRACVLARQDLVVIDNPAENDLLRSLGDVWIGATDLNSEGTWLALYPGDPARTDGRPLTYFNWGGGEPNNTQRCTTGETVTACPPGLSVDEDCASMRVDGFWNDSECNGLHPFVCEPLPGT